MQNAVGIVESVLVLGGRSEIGLAIAHRLVSAGARRVVLAARANSEDAAPIEAAQRRLRDAGAESVDGVAFDYADIDQHPGLVDEVFDTHGDFDVVVDAGGVLGENAAYERDPAAAGHAAVANFAGHVSVDLAVAQRLRAQGHGTLVVLSSVAGVRVRKANYVYGATKAGLDGLSQGLGDALAGSGARVLTVRPGFVRTQMTAGAASAPLAVDADRVADAVATALRLRRETVWVPSLFAPIFAVLRLLPRPLWRRLPF